MKRRWSGLPALAALAFFCSCAGRGGVSGAASAAPAPLARAMAVPTPGPAPCPSVTVRPGDSLWTLTRRAMGTGFLWRRLARDNGLSRPWTLRVGQRLKVPCGTALLEAGFAPAVSLTDAQRFGWRPVPEQAYGVGEKLTFAVQYAGITAGYATLSILGAEQRDGRPVYHIQAQARSLPFFDAFFKVRDRLDSYLDTDYAFSWGYEKHLSEGHFRADASYDYDQRADVIREPAKGTSAPMSRASQDVLSCYYYFRAQALAPGSVLHIPVTADDMKSYDLSVEVLGRDRVSTPAGTFDCLVVRPQLAFKGVFRQKGKVLMWVTDDARHLPVLIKSKIAIGSISIALK
ncbi:MAG: DUF3108 domain-containing protein, partial [bacterium]